MRFRNAKVWINANTNRDIIDLIDKPEGFKGLTINRYKLSTNHHAISLLRGASDMYPTLHRELLKLIAQKQQLKDKMIHFNVFRDILAINNDIIFHNLIEGETESLGVVGAFNVRKKKRITANFEGVNTKRVDWGASYKVKRALINAGRLPKKGDNGGEDWLIYRLEDGVWYHWIKKIASCPNKFYYKFVPTEYNNTGVHSSELADNMDNKSLFEQPIGIVQQLHLYRSINPHVELKYIRNQETAKELDYGI